jgi:enoyl-CoA hydratase/carnithine racemase
MWDAELHGGVALLTYTRPPDNVIGFADLAELDEALLRWASDDRARVIVITGGLPGYFIAHADLADVEALARGGDTGPYGPDAWERVLSRISAVPQPVIAAVNGQAWGGGFEVALSCLMRVASPAATFRFVEVADGAIPGAGGTQRLPRLIGLPRAARLILGGEVIEAGEAYHLGVVEAVLPEARFLDAVLSWTAPLAAQPRHSLAAAKRALVQGASLPLDQGLALEQDTFRRLLRSPQTTALQARRGRLRHPRVSTPSTTALIKRLAARAGIRSSAERWRPRRSRRSRGALRLAPAPARRPPRLRPAPRRAAHSAP